MKKIKKILFQNLNTLIHRRPETTYLPEKQPFATLQPNLNGLPAKTSLVSKRYTYYKISPGSKKYIIRCGAVHIFL